MSPQDLATVGFIDAWGRALLSRLEVLAAAATGPAASAEVVLYSVPRLAEVLDVDVATVRRWVRTGKSGKNGTPVKLRAYYFNSEPRIPWPALLAYERGEDFDLAELPAPQLAPPPAGAVAVPPRPLTQNEPPPPLRVAS